MDTETAKRSPYDLRLWAGLTVFCGAMMVGSIVGTEVVGDDPGGFEGLFLALAFMVFGILTSLFGPIWAMRRQRTNRGPGDDLWTLASVFGVVALAIMMISLVIGLPGSSSGLGFVKDTSGALVTGAFYAIPAGLAALVSALAAKHKDPPVRKEYGKSAAQDTRRVAAPATPRSPAPPKASTLERAQRIVSGKSDSADASLLRNVSIVMWAAAAYLLIALLREGAAASVFFLAATVLVAAGVTLLFIRARRGGRGGAVR